MKGVTRALTATLSIAQLASEKPPLAVTSRTMSNHRQHSESDRASTRRRPNPFAAFAASPSHRPTPTSTPTSLSRWKVVEHKSKDHTPNKKRPFSSTATCQAQAKRLSEESGAPLTQSFGAHTAANFCKPGEPTVDVHTLILGTHPSIQSLERNEYFGHPMK